MKKLKVFCLITILLTFFGSLAIAEQDNAVSPQSAGISQQKAVDIAQQQFTGRVIAIHHTDNAYRIKILSASGSVHIVLVNDADGAVISAH